jgi:RHS repeat-associated protein
VRLVIDDTGAVQNSYTYDAFGKSFDSEYAGNVTNPFKFTGQWFDSEISQYYLRARMYDPQLMRFTARDPVRGERQEPLTLHKYLYCLNDPVDCVDPTGESLLGVLEAISIWTGENADALVAGGLAFGFTYSLSISSAYQQFALSLAASMSDAWNTLTMAVNLQAINNLHYGAKQNREGTPWVPPERPEDRNRWRKAGRITMEIIGLTPVWGLLFGLDEEGTEEALEKINQELDDQYYWELPPEP